MSANETRVRTEVEVEGLPVVTNSLLPRAQIVVCGAHSPELNVTGGLEFQCPPALLDKLRDPSSEVHGMARELLAAYRERIG